MKARQTPGPLSCFSLAAWALMILLALTAGCSWVSRTTESVMTYFESTDTNLVKRVCLLPPETAVKELEKTTRQWVPQIKQAMSQAPGLKMVPFAKFNQAVAALPSRIRGSEERIIAAGRRLGLNAIIAAQVVDLSLDNRLEGIIGFRDNTDFLGLEANLRIYDVASGTVLVQDTLRPEVEVDSITATNMRQGQAAPQELVDALVVELTKNAREWIIKSISAQPWAGFILAVKGDKVQVTVGQDTGFGEGAVVVAYGKGEKLRSGAGTILYLPGPPVAHLRLTEIGPETSWALATPVITKKDKEKKAEATPLEPGMVVRSH